MPSFSNSVLLACAATASFTTASDDAQRIESLVARLDEQQAAMGALQAEIQRLTPSASRPNDEAALPRARRQLVADTSNYHGLRIETDEAIIALGEDGDVQVVRTGPDTVDVVADDFTIHGDVHADNLFVGGQDVNDICSCDGASTVVTLEALTGVSTEALTTHPIMVDFKVDGSWSPRYIFATAAAKEELLTQTYRLAGEPTDVRFTMDGDDGWGIGRASLAIGTNDPVVFACNQNYGEDPEDRSAGYFVDFDGDGGSSNNLIFAVEAACTSVVTVTSVTGAHTAADQSDTIMIKFMVDGNWTDETIYFTSSSEGQEQTSKFDLASAPTKVAFTDAGTDMWGFDSLTVNVDGTDYELSCPNTEDYPTEDSLNWVGGSSSTAPVKELIRDIVDAGCDDYVDVVFSATTATNTDSQTANDIMVSFKVDGEWTPQFLLAYSTSQEAVEEGLYALPSAPTDFRLETSGTDAYGVAFIDIRVGNMNYTTLCGREDILYIPPQGENGYWVKTGSYGPIEMAIENNCDTTLNLKVVTGTLSGSQTSDSIYVSFNVSGQFTDEVFMFGSASQGDIDEATFILAEPPTALQWHSTGTDAWGFDYLDVTIDGSHYVLSCVGDQTASGADTQHWVDHGGSTPDDLVVEIVDKSCA